MRAQLSTILNALLENHPELHYFQGLHDTASVLLVVCNGGGGGGSGDASSVACAYLLLERLALHHIRGALQPTLDEVQCVLDLLLPLVAAEHAAAGAFVRRAHTAYAETVRPIFALPWLLTWFSHSLDDGDTVARLLDFFIVSHPLMPIYVAAQVRAQLMSVCVSMCVEALY